MGVRMFREALLFSLAVSVTAQLLLTEAPTAYKDVLRRVSGAFTSTAVIEQEELTDLYGELFEKLECEEKVSDCQTCLSDLVQAVGVVNNEAEWNEASLVVMTAALNLTRFCSLNSNQMRDMDHSAGIVALIAEEENMAAVGEEEIEKLLDLLSHVYVTEEHHEEEETEDHGDDDHGDEDEAEEEEEHHEESDRCFGESVLLHYLSVDHEETIQMDRFSEMIGYIVSFMVQGWNLEMSGCSVLPRQYEVLDSLFDSLGNEDVIDESGFESLLSALEIGSVADGTAEEEDDGHGHKRSISTRSKRSAEDEESVAGKCMSEGNLAKIYELDLEAGITKEQFLVLCPALIQQKVGNYCVGDMSDTTEVEELSTPSEAYGYGTIAVVIISLLALIGALLIPCLHKQVVKYILNMFVALGVGTMLADALLHLIPQALGIHAHDESEVEEEMVHESTNIQLVVASAIYGFFLLEKLLSKLRPKAAQKHRHGHSHDLNGKISPVNGDQDVDTPVQSISADGVENEKKPAIPSVALLILIGDGIHNLLDGIAIGAAFSTSVQDGIGTSIAVFCHELPHELGDFSILLQAGMTKVKALMFNLLSASMCLVGLYIGVALGSNEMVRKWLLAITAGMFIYVALVDMLPELMTETDDDKWWLYFIVQNVGMILGIALMLIIAIYEDRLIHNH